MLGLVLQIVQLSVQVLPCRESARDGRERLGVCRAAATHPPTVAGRPTTTLGSAFGEVWFNSRRSTMVAMSVRPKEFEPETDLLDVLSPFRAAFAKARMEAIPGTDLERPTPTPDAAARGKRGPAHERFEVRIERRRGKRSADTKRWNKLGDNGWELVAIRGEQAFFRRTRPQTSRTRRPE
jgi:hypothetical protein